MKHRHIALSEINVREERALRTLARVLPEAAKSLAKLNQRKVIFNSCA